jgi:hypothetical protein
MIVWAPIGNPLFRAIAILTPGKARIISLVSGIVGAGNISKLYKSVVH